MLQKFVKIYISATHGWAVADQFEATFDGGRFEEQNLNALTYISKAVNELLNSDVLSEDAFDDLGTYVDSLDEYLMGTQANHTGSNPVPKLPTPKH